MQVPALLRVMAAAAANVTAPAPTAPPRHGRRRPATHDLCLTARAAAEATAHAREPPAATAMLQPRLLHRSSVSLPLPPHVSRAWCRRSSVSWPAQAGHPRLVPNRERRRRLAEATAHAREPPAAATMLQPRRPPLLRCHGRRRPATHDLCLTARAAAEAAARRPRTPRRCHRDVAAPAPAADPCHGRRRPATHYLRLTARAAAEAAAHAFEPPRRCHRDIAGRWVEFAATA